MRACTSQLVAARTRTNVNAHMAVECGHQTKSKAPSGIGPTHAQQQEDAQMPAAPAGDERGSEAEPRRWLKAAD